MTLKATSKNNFLVLFCIALFFVSCDANSVFDSYVSIPNNSWEKEHEVTFNFSVVDTISKRNVFINLRNNKEYPFSNLFLITRLQFPDGQKVIDTLEYEMADFTGKFLGEGFTDIKENKLFFKEGKNFPQSGDYSVAISQAMRKNGEVNGVISLKGVTDVGFRIEKIQ